MNDKGSTLSRPDISVGEILSPRTTPVRTLGAGTRTLNSPPVLKNTTLSSLALARKRIGDRWPGDATTSASP